MSAVPRLPSPRPYRPGRHAEDPVAVCSACGHVATAHFADGPCKACPCVRIETEEVDHG